MPNYTTEYKARGTFATIPNIHFALKELTPGEFKVYASLADRARDPKHPGRSWASQKKIGEDCGYNREQVNRHIASLARKGLIHITPRLSDDGFKVGNYYQILQVESSAEITAANTEAPAENDMTEAEIREKLGY